MLNSLNQKQKLIFFIIISFMILIIIYYFYSKIYEEDSLLLFENTALNSNDIIQNSFEVSEYNQIKENETNDIIVYICGAVKESKVITLKENSRICDAIDAVGGLKDNADLNNINLALILKDGEKIYIPKKGEQLINSPINSNTVETNQYNNNKININRATQTELESLPGIGPSTALKIINYRNENGNFYSIEDIKKVSGIGNEKYEKIKNNITIN